MKYKSKKSERSGCAILFVIAVIGIAVVFYAVYIMFFDDSLRYPL